jgi:hypothetical protein
MEVLVHELPKSIFFSVIGAEPPIVKKDWNLVDTIPASMNTYKLKKQYREAVELR